MNSRTILIAYLVFFCVKFVFQTVLILLNTRNAARDASLPSKIADRIGPEVRARASLYTVSRSRLALVSSVVSSIFLLFIVLSGGFGFFDAVLRRIVLPDYLHGIMYVFSVGLIFGVIGLPFSLFNSFVIERRFGFNKMTPSLFLIDLVKGLALSVVLGLPLLLGVFWLMDTAGGFWWLFAFAAVAVFQFLVTLIFPLVVAPLFNKFTLLRDGPLKTRLEVLAKKLNFRVSGIFVMDGSKRSAHSNAYFTGLGKVKRIVLFDTLVKQMEVEGIAAVLAHEIGHEKLLHVVKGFVASLLIMLVGFFIVSLLADWQPLFAAFGFPGPSSYGILTILAFCAGPFTFFLTPLGSAWSRKHEYEADRFALAALKDDTANADSDSESRAESNQTLAESLIVLSRENLSNLNPHPWYSFFYYSHPTLVERIQAMEREEKFGV